MLALAVSVLASAPALAADVTGRWSGEVKLPTGQSVPFVAEFQQQGQAVTGKLAGINGAPDVEIRDGRLDNDRLTFWGLRRIGGADVRFDYAGAVGPQAIDVQIVRADGAAAPALDAPAATAAPLTVGARHQPSPRRAVSPG